MSEEMEDMATRVVARCQSYDKIFGPNVWLWEKFYEEFSKDCGREVVRPELDGKKDIDNPIRKRFAKALRKIIPKKDYPAELVELHKHELVEAILSFTI